MRDAIIALWAAKETKEIVAKSSAFQLNEFVRFLLPLPVIRVLTDLVFFSSCSSAE